MRDIDTLTRAWLGGLLTLTELTENERRRIHTRVLALAIADARHAEIVTASKTAAAAEPVPVKTRTCRRCHQVLELDQFGRDLKKRDDKKPWCKACINALAAQAREQVSAWHAVTSSSRGHRGWNTEGVESGQCSSACHDWDERVVWAPVNVPIRYELDDLLRRIVVTVEGPFQADNIFAIMARQRAE
jgi:hypothetical protein